MARIVPISRSRSLTLILRLMKIETAMTKSITAATRAPRRVDGADDAAHDAQDLAYRRELEHHAVAAFLVGLVLDAGRRDGRYGLGVVLGPRHLEAGRGEGRRQGLARGREARDASGR